MALDVGSPAPQFTLVAAKSDGFAPVSLAELLEVGPAVLLFVPAAFTGVCTRELCSRNDALAGFKSSRAVTVGIAIDSPYALKVWAERDGIEIPLLSDLSRTVIQDYEVAHENLYGMGGPVAERAAFVVGTDGIIQYAEQCAKLGDEPNYEAIQACIDKFQ